MGITAWMQELETQMFGLLWYERRGFHDTSSYISPYLRVRRYSITSRYSSSSPYPILLSSFTIRSSFKGARIAFTVPFPQHNSVRPAMLKNVLSWTDVVSSYSLLAQRAYPASREASVYHHDS